MEAIPLRSVSVTESEGRENHHRELRQVPLPYMGRTQQKRLCISEYLGGRTSLVFEMCNFSVFVVCKKAHFEKKKKNIQLCDRLTDLTL